MVGHPGGGGLRPLHLARPGRQLPRRRKLLLHRGEIDRLVGKLNEPGLTLVPLKVYFQNGMAKVEIAVARGKRQWDKRQAMAERDAKREADRALRSRNRGGE